MHTGNETSACGICQELFATKDPIVNLCEGKHTFHLYCLNQWKADTCPLCRTEYDSGLCNHDHSSDSDTEEELRSRLDREYHYYNTHRLAMLVSASRLAASTATESPSNGRVNLRVPFSEKDAAKALGAKWDPVLKVWFAPNGENQLILRWT